ncbi:hypothetical protein ABZS77_26800 [Micromonospora sp. NPDC005298]|uniref:hypothetical protein n=1 Tax=Micromonospora sp. NPDC005298 TaxID=3156873 RepID=UPI0033AAAF4B
MTRRAFPLLPATGFRAEVTRVLEVLQEVAQAAGGRFVVEEGDVAGAPFGEVLDMISSDEDERTPAGKVLSTTAESDEDFPRRYLAAGDERLAWLHDQAAHTRGAQRLDHSRDSLAPIWAIGRLELCPPMLLQTRGSLKTERLPTPDGRGGGLRRRVRPPRRTRAELAGGGTGNPGIRV